MAEEKQGSGRFDYVAYDELAQTQQAYYKAKMVELEKALDQHKPGRAHSLALTAMEECYMWIGKMIRDEQVQRNDGAPLQEGRGNE